MGGDFGGTGRTVLPNLRWGTAHAYVPPIFGGETLCHEKCPHPIPNTYRIVIANLKSDDIQHPSTHLFYCYCAFQAKLRPAIASLILNFHNEGTETKR